jgi:LysM repeat protein
VASTIGIKIANGEFYSIVEENSSVKKRLVLTTVHDKQRSVQIDLYRSFTKTMADALYIGSLVVEKIKPKLKGEPSIEMVIASSKEGTISADAIDLDASPNGEHHYLSVSLKSLDDDTRDYNLPDFELEQNEPPPTGLYEKANAIKEQKDKSFPWPVLVAAVLVLLAVIFGVWYTLFWEGSPLKTRTPSRSQPVSAAPSRSAGTGETAPPAQDEPAQPPREEAKPVETPKAEPSRTAPEAPVINAPAAAPVSTVQKRTRTPAPVSTYKVPTTIPKNGAPYTIRWGDTLWDIADAFYRNPWLYPRIARFNNIRNPDLIISGTTIRVPPRN